VPASDSCVRITPDVDNTFSDDDKLPNGRVMGNFILLPNGKLFLANGVNQGTAGYGNDVRCRSLASIHLLTLLKRRLGRSDTHMPLRQSSSP
jgi:hypothetical protein